MRENILDSIKPPFVITKSLELVGEDSDSIDINLTIDGPKSIEIQKLVYNNISEALLHKQISKKLKINFKCEIIAHKIKSGLSRNTKIKNIIAVTSGKGGVGKSTISINLATSLAKTGAKVGLLDCDIYGPSIPRLCGSEGFKPEVIDSLFVPLEKYELQIMSFGFLVAENQPVIWRGSMVNKAVEQMLMDSKWNDLDYLIIDMPPGTGDIQLTMAQKLPITATLVVTTPQDLALVDVKKSISMFEKLGIPCLGAIENMTTHICNNCGHIEDIFGYDAIGKLQKDGITMNLLGQLPLNIEFCNGAESGTPIILSNETIAKQYQNISYNVLSELSKLGKDFSSKLSQITVMNEGLAKT